LNFNFNSIEYFSLILLSALRNVRIFVVSTNARNYKRFDEVLNTYKCVPSHPKLSCVGKY